MRRIAFFLGDYDNNQGRNKKSTKNSDLSFDLSDDLPFYSLAKSVATNLYFSQFR
jgi:hypothetical protein